MGKVMGIVEGNCRSVGDGQNGGTITCTSGNGTRLGVGMNLGGTKARRLVKGLESFLSLIVNSFLGTCNFSMLGIKVGFDHSKKHGGRHGA